MFLFEKILQKILPPREVRDTVGHIKSFLAEYSNFSKDIIKHKAIALAKQTHKTVNFIAHEGHHPEHLAILLIIKAITVELPLRLRKSEHSNEVRDMMKLWDIATVKMLQKKYYTDKEYHKDCDWIDTKCNFMRTNITPEQKKSSDYIRSFFKVRKRKYRKRKSFYID